MLNLVSCLCVSKPARWGQLQRAIADFVAQTYPARELIIVVDRKNDYAGVIEDYIARDFSVVAPIKVFCRPVLTQLDGLLYALCQARGDYIALWDDDNLNHPTRLEFQIEEQCSFPEAMTAFGESLYYFHSSNELFFVNYGNPAALPAERCAVSTLMGPRDVFPAFEPLFRTSPAELLVNSIFKTGKKLVALHSLCPMHLVGVSADNLRTYNWHRKLAQSNGCTAAWLNVHADELMQAFDTFQWDQPFIDVAGCDASAFTYPAKKLWSLRLYPVKTQDDTVEERTEHV